MQWLRTLMVTLLLEESMRGQATTILREVGKDVLLPCTCRVDEEGKKSYSWIAEKDDEDDEVEVITSTSEGTIPEYVNRARVIDDGANCSLRLSNVTLADEMAYVCLDTQGALRGYRIHLIVAAINCTSMISDKTSVQYQYSVTTKGRHEENKIYWLRDGHRVNHQSSVHIDASSNLNILRSTLTLEKGGNIKCVIKGHGGQIIDTKCPIPEDLFGDSNVWGNRYSFTIILVVSTLSMVLLVMVILHKRCRSDYQNKPLDWVLRFKEVPDWAASKKEVHSRGNLKKELCVTRNGTWNGTPHLKPPSDADDSTV